MTKFAFMNYYVVICNTSLLNIKQHNMTYQVTDPSSEYLHQTLEQEAFVWEQGKKVGVTLWVEDEEGRFSVGFTFEQVLEVEELTEDEKQAYYHEQEEMERQAIHPPYHHLS